MAILLRCFDRTLNIVVCLIYSALTMVAFAQVLIRYQFGGSLPWSEEAVRFLFIWLCFIGFAVTMNRGGHIIVDFFVSHFPTNVRRILSLVSDTLVLGLLAFLLFQGWAVVRVTMYNLSPAMQMPMGYVYSVLPLSAGLLAINTVRVAYRHWQGDFGPWNP